MPSYQLMVVKGVHHKCNGRSPIVSTERWGGGVGFFRFFEGWDGRTLAGDPDCEVGEETGERKRKPTGMTGDDRGGERFAGTGVPEEDVVGTVEEIGDGERDAFGNDGETGDPGVEDEGLVVDPEDTAGGIEHGLDGEGMVLRTGDVGAGEE